MAGDESPQHGAVLRGKYRVERVLGSGGMGVVVLATHLRMERLVAIKLLQPECRDRPDVVLRFAREARAASQLRGEHAVRILDVDDGDEGDPFLVMEYLEGKDLQEVLAAEGPLPLELAVSYALQACEGIAEAHACGIIHRDLKPANLFLTTRADGSALVKILDFGISKAIEREKAGDFLVTKPQSAIGSPSYMSPEQIRDAGEVDVRTDIWSLGVVLHQLLTDTLPFEATTTAALAVRITVDPPRPLRALLADVPEDLERVVLRCLEKSASDRFADMTALARALAPFAPGGESGASRIARVVEASAQRDALRDNRRGEGSPPRSSTPSASSASARGGAGERRPATPGPATGSIHGVPSSSLQRALVTEDGSSVVANPAPSVEAARPRWPTVALAAAAFASLVIAGVVAFGRGASSPSTVTPARQPPSGLIADAAAATGALGDASPGASSRTGAEPAREDASAERLEASTRPRPSLAPLAPRKPAASPTTTSAPPLKNPMDIDFR